MQFWNWDVQVGRGRVSFASVTEGWGGRTQKFQCYTPAAQWFRRYVPNFYLASHL